MRRNSGGRVVVLRGGLSLTGGAELQDSGWIAQAEGAEIRQSPREAVWDR